MKKSSERSRNDEMQPVLFPSRELDKVVVRLPDGMRDALKRAAEKSGRSMNSEIVERLQASIAYEGIDISSLNNALAEKEKYIENILTAITREIEFSKYKDELIAEKDRKINSLSVENESILYEILSHFNEVPASLSIWAHYMIRIHGTNIDWADEKENISELISRNNAKNLKEQKEKLEKAKSAFERKTKEIRDEINKKISTKKNS